MGSHAWAGREGSGSAIGLSRGAISSEGGTVDASKVAGAETDGENAAVFNVAILGEELVEGGA